MHARSISDFNLLPTLELLVRTRSVSLAAEALGVSQPAVSRSLARLRDQFGDPLLVRGRSGMVLTARAAALVEPLRQWINAGEAMFRPAIFHPAGLDRVFRIASTDLGVISVVSPALASISEAAPNASLAVEPLSTRSVAGMADGAIDLVITGWKPEGAGLRARHLFSETFLGLARADHPVGDREPTVEAFFSWPHVVAIVGDGYGEGKPALPQRRVAASAVGFAVIPYLVSESDAFAILPSRAALKFSAVHGFRTFTLPVAVSGFDYYVAWHERSDGDAAVHWLMDQLAAPFETPAAESNTPSRLG